MSTIYFHIPFCKQACTYCDFHFSTRLNKKTELLDAMKRELLSRKDYLRDRNIESIYFGGGTPSLLNSSEIMGFIEWVEKNFELSPGVEITLEANPDDLDLPKLKDLRTTSVNRFSIGIQSFFEEDLKFMHRAHNPEQAESSVKRAQDLGFENITVDLIYGFPLLTNEKWKRNIQKVLDLNVPHVSCYSMTVEPRTALSKLIQKGRTQPMNEGQSAGQFLYLMDTMEKSGFIQYEISNFGKEGKFSRHNTAYWKGVHYLGIGPSAHSYDGDSRQWNVSDNDEYTEKVVSGKAYSEKEILTAENKFNEYIMTGLRTMWGIEGSKIKDQGSEKVWEQLNSLLKKGLLQQKGNTVTLTKEGKLLADKIAADLFI